MAVKRKPTSKVEEAIAKAELAACLAQEALATIQAQDLILGSLIARLRESNTLSQQSVRTIFLGAAAVIDAATPADALQIDIASYMRRIVSKTAEGFGVEVPPAGPPGISRRQ